MITIPIPNIFRRIIQNEILFVILTLTLSSLFVYGNLLFRPNTFLLWSDAPFEFYADEILWKIQDSWVMDNFGMPAVYRGDNIWMGLEWLTLTFIPVVMANHLLFLIPLLLRGFSMYYLLSTLIRRNDIVSIFCKLIPSIFFIAVPLDIYAFWNNGLTFAFMPLVLAFFIRGAFADSKAVYIILGALSYVFLFAHPLFAFYTFIFLIIFTIVLVIDSNKLATLFYFLKFLLVAGLFNMLTLIPLIMMWQTNMSSYFLDIAFLSEGNLASSMDFNRLIYSARLLTAQPSLPYFSSLLVISLGFFMVAYCYASVFHIGSRDRMQIFAKWLILSSLLITLFATGVTYPFFSSIYLFFYRTIPGLFANMSYWLYPLMVLYACLIGLTTYLISDYIIGLNQKSRHVTVLLRKFLAVSIIGIAILSIVAYNGAVYTNANLGFRGNEGTTIPDDYFELHDFLNKGNVGDYQMLIYPPPAHFIKYTWYDSNLHIVDIVDKFSPVPVIIWRVLFSPGDLIQSALFDLDKGQTHDALSVLGMHSIKYIFVHKDIPQTHMKDGYQLPYSKTVTILSSSPDITLVKNSTNYMLFEINKSLVVPMMFAVSATDVNATGYISNPGTVIQGSSKGFEKFDLRIPGGKEVILVLNKAYSSDWILSGDQLDSEQIMINGLVNGWRINSPKETVAHVTLESTFWISVGKYLSIVSIISVVVITFRREITSKLKVVRRLHI